jgi:hypothetical protein
MSNPCRPNSEAAKTQIMKFIEIHHESLNLLEFLCFLCFLFGFLNLALASLATSSNLLRRQKIPQPSALLARGRLRNTES